MPEMSIVIPVYNEERYIQKCLDSILSSAYPREKLEIILVDGNSRDRTVEILTEYAQKYSCIKILHNPSRHTPISMNIGIKASHGSYICILSAHAQYDKRYFIDLQKHIKVLDADCIGGVLLTDVKNKNVCSCSIKSVLQHQFGVGNAMFRTGTREIIAVDTVAFGCYKKSVFEEYGLFDERLIRNQDIEMNKRITNGGGKIYLVPDVQCTYYARETFSALAKNSYKNGYWNLLTAYYTKSLKSLSPRHFIPLLFLLSLLLPLLFSLFVPELGWIALGSLLSYLSLVIIISLKMKNSFNSLFYLIGSFIILHISYGWGSLIGLFGIIKKFIKGKD
jgi:glycosyltransferase involved in cell wall biosynthesis